VPRRFRRPGPRRAIAAFFGQPTRPLTAKAAIARRTPKLLSPPANKQADLHFDTEQDKTYVIYQSIDLCNWQKILRHRATTGGPMSHPVRLDSAPRCFWKAIGFTPQE